MLTAKLTGEQAREKVNMIRVARMGYDGSSCYLFLQDGTSIQIKPASLSRESNECELEFIHRTPTLGKTSGLTNSLDNEGIKKGSKVE